MQGHMWPRFVAVSAAAALVVAGCSGSPGEGDAIVIGLVEDTSGPGAAYSEITAAAVRVAVDRINDEGGVLGRELEVVSDDDGSDPSRSPTVTRRLIGDGASVVMFTTGSGAVIANKSVMQEAEVPGLPVTSAASQVIEDPDADYMYLQAVTTHRQGEAFVGAFEETGVERLAILSDDSPTMAAYNEVLEEVIAAADVEIVAHEEAATDAADVTAQVSRVESADPDAVLVSTVGGQIEVLYQNTAHQVLSDDTQMYSLSSIGNQPQLWDLADSGALDDLVYVGALSEDNPRTEEARAALEEANGDDFVMTDYDAQAYSLVHMVAEIMEDAGSAEPADVQDGLNSMSAYEAYFGLPEFTLSYAEGDHDGADGACGVVFTVFEDNEPSGAWDTYQPSC